MSSGICISCGNQLLAWLRMPLDVKRNQETQFSRLLRCKHCGLARLDPIPLKHEVGRFYELDSYYTHGESHIRNPQPQLLDRILTKVSWWLDFGRKFDIIEKIKTNQISSALEIGCGHGERIASTKGLVGRVVGVDPDPVALEILAARGIEFYQGTAEDIPAQLFGAKFDFVMMSHSLEHTIDPIKSVSNVSNLLTPGGFFYVEVPNAESLHFNRFLQASENFDTPRHIWQFTRASLLKILQRSNFELIEQYYIGFCRHHSRGWREWEMEIQEKLAKSYGIRVPRHTYLASVKLLIESAFAPPVKKYDTFGLLLKKR